MDKITRKRIDGWKQSMRDAGNTDEESIVECLAWLEQAMIDGKEHAMYYTWAAACNELLAGN